MQSSVYLSQLLHLQMCSSLMLRSALLKNVVYRYYGIFGRAILQCFLFLWIKRFEVQFLPEKGGCDFHSEGKSWVPFRLSQCLFLLCPRDHLLVVDVWLGVSLLKILVISSRFMNKVWMPFLAEDALHYYLKYNSATFTKIEVKIATAFALEVRYMATARC